LTTGYYCIAFFLQVSSGFNKKAVKIHHFFFKFAHLGFSGFKLQAFGENGH
jgi:hypothetical protein